MELLRCMIVWGRRCNGVYHWQEFFLCGCFYCTCWDRMCVALAVFDDPTMMLYRNYIHQCYVIRTCTTSENRRKIRIIIYFSLSTSRCE